MTYFSEKEEGERPRENDQISEGAWGGIKALVSGRIEDGSFGAAYPNSCPDGHGPIGADANAFWSGMQGDIPNFQNLQAPVWFNAIETPRTLDILDMVQFCWRCVGKPIPNGYHGHFGHSHLRFDIETGRGEFRNDINRILRRNGLVYNLRGDGNIERLAPPVFREALASAHFHTRDSELNRMMETARRKFLNPDEVVRREALEVLWDAWERLKTLGNGPDKKTQIATLLDATAGPSAPLLRQVLEKEAVELTWVGNNMQIRHSEKGKERVATGEHIDYLFHRLFSLVQTILRVNKEI